MSLCSDAVKCDRKSARMRLLFVAVLFVTNSHSGSSRSDITSLKTAVIDDTYNSEVDISICKSAIFAQCESNLGSKVQINETVSCLLDNLDQLDNESTCATLLKSYIEYTLDICDSDQVDYCSNTNVDPAVGYVVPLISLTCLANNYWSCNGNCKYRLQDLFGIFIPCVYESKRYCPDRLNVMLCLSHALVELDEFNANDFSLECVERVGLWSSRYDADVNHYSYFYGAEYLVNDNTSDFDSGNLDNYGSGCDGVDCNDDGSNDDGFDNNGTDSAFDGVNFDNDGPGCGGVDCNDDGHDDDRVNLDGDGSDSDSGNSDNDGLGCNGVDCNNDGLDDDRVNLNGGGPDARPNGNESNVQYKDVS